MKLYFISVSIALFACCQHNTIVQNNDVVRDSVVFDVERQGNTTVEYSEPYTLKNLPEGIRQYLSSDCKVIKFKEGDLNLDSLNDLIVITEKKQFTVGDTSNTAKRSVWIFIRQFESGYKPSLKNDNIIYFIDKSADDPFDNIVIKNGYFSFEQSGKAGALHWSRIITFKYSSQSLTWYLHKDAGEVYHPIIGDPENKAEKINKRSKDFGQIAFDQFNVYSDEWTSYVINNIE